MVKFALILPIIANNSVSYHVIIMLLNLKALVRKYLYCIIIKI